MENQHQIILRKPAWLKIKLPKGENFSKLNQLVKHHQLNTICTSGKCPNIGECWEAGTATFMILGEVCTRACKFCAVKTGKPEPVDWQEPERIAESVNILQLKHCVLTSVDRDDLPDGGAQLWANTIVEIKKQNPHTTIETLIPDFDGRLTDLEKIFAAAPEIISHNMETVRRLTPLVRSRAKYDRSLEVIKHISNSRLIAKSGIMVGIGETAEEVFETMDDLINAGCQIFTIGQYLQPTKENLAVVEYVSLEQFAEYKKVGLAKGFRFVESNPLVRSSYHAEKQI